MEGSIVQEGMAVCNVYVPNNSVKPHATKTNRISRRIDESTIIVGDFHAPLSEVDRPAGRKSIRTVLNSVILTILEVKEKNISDVSNKLF